MIFDFSLTTFLSIETSGVARGGQGGHLPPGAARRGAPKSCQRIYFLQDIAIGAPPLPVIKIVKYCEVWGGGGGALGGAKILQKNNGAPSLCH